MKNKLDFCLECSIRIILNLRKAVQYSVHTVQADNGKVVHKIGEVF